MQQGITRLLHSRARGRSALASGDCSTRRRAVNREGQRTARDTKRVVATVARHSRDVRSTEGGAGQGSRGEGHTRVLSLEGIDRSGHRREVGLTRGAGTLGRHAANREHNGSREDTEDHDDDQKFDKGQTLIILLRLQSLESL